MIPDDRSRMEGRAWPSQRNLMTDHTEFTRFDMINASRPRDSVVDRRRPSVHILGPLTVWAAYGVSSRARQMTPRGRFSTLLV